MPAPLTALLLEQAVGNRHGLVLRPQRAPLSRADVEGIVHIGVPRSVDSPWESAAGGVARQEPAARAAAIAEAIERSCSAQARLTLRTRGSLPPQDRIDAEEFALFAPDQRCHPEFPHGRIYDDECPYVEVFALPDNAPRWVPQPFVTLQDPHRTGVPTSSGLAAGVTPSDALNRGVQELIERDALMVTWLHGLPGRAIVPPEAHAAEVERLGGQLWLFDLTPAYSPHPVAAVMGGIPKRGRWRYSLGVACREDWASAAEKAYLEWNQGVMFAGIYGDYVDTSGLTDAAALRSFDEHAMFYTRNPQLWPDLPLLRQDGTLHPPPDAAPGTGLAEALARAGLRVYYREITTIDAVQAGLHVVKALSPDLAMIYSHERWPFLHKVDAMLASRYPDRLGESAFPNRAPHPLG